MVSAKTALLAAFKEILSGANVAPTPMHRQIAQMPFAAIITTNYDRLIEQSYSQAVNVVTENDAEQLADCLGSGEFFVLKPHGDLYRPETIVLAQTDYDQLILNNEAFWKALDALVLANAFIFAGYSLEDPDFQLNGYVLD
jgi:SIR2-like domain